VRDVYFGVNEILAFCFRENGMQPTEHACVTAHGGYCQFGTHYNVTIYAQRWSRDVDEMKQM